MTTTLGKRGQVVIPIEIRSQKKLNTGDDFMVTVEGNRIVLEKVQRSAAARRRPKVILKRGKLPVIVTPKGARPLEAFRRQCPSLAHVEHITGTVFIYPACFPHRALAIDADLAI